MKKIAFVVNMFFLFLFFTLGSGPSCLEKSNETESNPSAYTEGSDTSSSSENYRFNIMEDDFGVKMVEDRQENLIWQKDYISKIKFWDTVNYCKNLHIGGYSDWRIPTELELFSLIDLSANPANSNFPDMPLIDFWTSESDQNSYDLISFKSGEIISTCSYCGFEPALRCVRYDEEDTKRFTSIIKNYEQEVVIDNQEKKMWTKDYAKDLADTSAIEYCENLNYGEYSDWRLPSKQELEALIDNSRKGILTGFPFKILPSDSQIFAAIDIADDSDKNPLFHYYWNVDFKTGTSQADYNIGLNALCIRNLETSQMEETQSEQ